MADLLAKGAAWLARQRTRHAASPVTIARGASSIVVPATKGRSKFDVDDGNGFVNRIETQDFIVLAADYAFDGVAVEPVAGDQIFDGPAGEAVVYEVMSMPGVQAFERSDHFGLELRIHTKRVDRQ